MKAMRATLSVHHRTARISKTLVGSSYKAQYFHLFKALYMESYKASQMFCFRTQCTHNKTFETPRTRLWMTRNTRLIMPPAPASSWNRLIEQVLSSKIWWVPVPASLLVPGALVHHGSGKRALYRSPRRPSSYHRTLNQEVKKVHKVFYKITKL